MSENLRLLGKYSDAMASGTDDAVYEFFSPDFHSHVSERINPEVIGTDIRGSEQQWWREAKAAFPDMVFTVDLLIEKDDLIVSNWSVKGRTRARRSTASSRRGSRCTSTAPRSCASATARSSSTGAARTARTATA